MKKRKLLTAVMVSILALGVVIGTTLAYLTAEADEITNTFTVGKIVIELDEPEYEKLYKTEDPLLYPGAVITKDPTVTITKDSEDSYVYMLIDNLLNFEFTDSKGNKVDAISLNIDNANWIEVEGYEHDTQTLYRYKNVVTKPTADVGTVLPPLFTTVTVHDEVDSDNIELLKDKTIVIYAYAHQATALGETDPDEEAIAFFTNKFS